MIVGLDFGMATGFGVLSDAGDLVASGSWSNKGPREGKKTEDKSRRYASRYGVFNKQLLALLDSFPASKVAYEFVWAHKGSRAAQAYAGWMSITLLICDMRDIEPFPVAFSTVKSVATLGKVPAHIKSEKNTAKRRLLWKTELIDCAEEAWGHRPATDDEADALWVAQSCLLGKGCT